MNAPDVLINGAAGATLAFVGSIAISLFRSVKLLDDDRAFEISTKESELRSEQEKVATLEQAIASPQPSKLESGRAAAVQAAFADAKADHLKVLEYILLHARADQATLQYGLEVDPMAANQLLTWGITKGILNAAQGNRSYVEIKTEFVAAVELFLHGPKRPVTPSPS